MYLFAYFRNKYSSVLSAPAAATAAGGCQACWVPDDATISLSDSPLKQEEVDVIVALGEEVS